VSGAALAGRRVVVTRPEEQAGPLVDLLAAAGAMPIVVPLIEIVDEPAALDALGGIDITGFEWVITTSPNAARRLLDVHRGVLGDARRDVARPALAAIGTATARVLGACQLVPEDQRAEGLLAALPPRRDGGSGSVLVVQAGGAARTLVEGLRAGGWDVVVNAPYRSVAAHPSAREQLAALAADAVLFASGSAAHAWVAVFGTTTPPITVAIGPQTAAAARASGLEVTAIAQEHSLDGLVAELSRVLSPRGRH
jgi:uroporphyrinogen-III synthase